MKSKLAVFTALTGVSLLLGAWLLFARSYQLDLPAEIGGLKAIALKVEGMT
jgi:hypothetical protein